MRLPSILARWFRWDVANFKGTLTILISPVPMALTSWQFGAYSEQNAPLWWLAIAVAAVLGGTALWRGAVYEWQEWRSIERQVRKEARDSASTGERH